MGDGGCRRRAGVGTVGSVSCSVFFATMIPSSSDPGGKKRLLRIRVKTVDRPSVEQHLERLLCKSKLLHATSSLRRERKTGGGGGGGAGRHSDRLFEARQNYGLKHTSKTD